MGEVDYRPLSPGELLVSVEGRYSAGGDFNEFIGWLALECWVQGSLAVNDDVIPVSKVDTLVAVAGEAQKRFDTVIEYLHETHEITVNRLEMLSIMRDLEDKDTSAAIDMYISNNVFPEMKRVMYGDEPADCKGIDDIDSNLAVDLIETMLTLGTFYRDRNRYDSDEKRRLHDHAMSILEFLSNKITNT